MEMKDMQTNSGHCLGGENKRDWAINLSTGLKGHKHRWDIFIQPVSIGHKIDIEVDRSKGEMSVI